jgi:hypothetical protein
VAESNWKVSVEECDVEDKERLTAFRERADGWIHALDQDDENSVTAQIFTMMGDDAKWRALNEARRLAANRADAGTSGIVASLLDRGYVAGQVIAISRLIEVGNARQPARQVNSLRRLVEEITANRELLTREVFVSRDGLPFSYETIRHHWPAATAGTSAGAYWTNEGQTQWIMAQMQHQLFDRLSGQKPTDRSRNDLIEKSFFDRLSEALNDPIFSDIIELRHKSIAHAADAFSRSKAKNLRKGMALDDFAKAHFLLLGVFQVVAVGLLYQSWLTSPIATPQFDIFEHLDLPIVAPDDVARLHEFWDSHTGEREDWMNEAFDKLMPS